ncbi:DUF302 domain-containing protein [Pedobacter sp. ISL-68]|uniref:DUF302 domain-containing protein n=1 Tax=unclassified Pedobacter TaxID=2628915 RepID=UPI001BE8DE67|nr:MULTISPECIES: DUF302 domain-containing protein [unclassified Pedobacter]MBT2560075.1 DUF302 domain-containing protein [Pedobacter sp. ISL-64]MBT2589054.1 DUF302 domain-containing protein [Pedobacter sp. ISL-68]
MKTEYFVTHLSVPLKSNYQAFTQELEKALGKLDLPALAKAGHDSKATELAIMAMQGEEGMTLFNLEDLGQLLSLNGPPRTGKRYFVGNYQRASQIISSDIRLGLYAPLRVLVYETENGSAHVEYELPSSQFSRFGVELITKSGLGLDGKLERLIAACDLRASK